MGKIRQLDQHVANLIAAGEVIERASSVVKELVENSIDAGATLINIALTGSGLKEIIVSDNGCGMDKSDVKMAFLPHATSKIFDPNDLFNIKTLGFRGEALPSIISVSNFKIKTSVDGKSGLMVALKGGEITSEAVIAHPIGTEIQVKNLFFNTPARLQNLKSENMELSYITDYVTKVALANPYIGFKLTNNNKLVFQTYENSTLLESIKNIYANDVAKDMIPIAGSNGLFKLGGYTSKISTTRSNKNQINIIVNGRTVRNNSLVNALISAYDTMLTVGRYPISILDIYVDYSLVDVNVHPAKLEVRFSEEDKLIELIKDTVSSALSRTNMIVDLDEYDEEDENESEEDNLEFISKEAEDSFEAINNIYDEKPDPVKPEAVKFEEQFFTFTSDDKHYVNPFEKEDKEETVNIVKEFDGNPFEKKEEIIEETDDVEFEYETFEEEPLEYNEEDIPNFEDEEEVYEKKQNVEVEFKSVEKEEIRKLPKLYYIGQLFGTYLVAQDENHLYLIDQHAANERINYEKILGDLKKDLPISYETLVPVRLTFTPSEALLIEEKMDIINKLGIILEDFGGGTYTVREIPVWIKPKQEKEFVEEILSHIMNDRKTEKYQFLDNIAKSLACKKSVKANEYLSQNQVDYILEDLEKCNNPYTCPHGRPIIIKYSKYEIEKWFKRVQ